jgi:hypothetical protein
LPYRVDELAGLPAPVVRYFRLVLRDGQARVRMARVRQAGTMKMGDAESTWRPFAARELFRVSSPGFLWDASIAQAPGLPVYVRDGYTDGVGALRASVLGLKTVADVSGGDAMADGELYRYLSEAVWFPTALLPAAGVTWTAIGADAALATVHDGVRRVSAEFRFDPAGEIVSVYVAARGRVVGAVTTMAPWEGHYWQYVERDGMRIPERADVGWQVGGTWQPYWRGRVTSIEYEFAN